MLHAHHWCAPHIYIVHPSQKQQASRIALVVAVLLCGSAPWNVSADPSWCGTCTCLLGCVFLHTVCTCGILPAASNTRFASNCFYKTASWPAQLVSVSRARLLPLALHAHRQVFAWQRTILVVPPAYHGPPAAYILACCVAIDACVLNCCPQQFKLYSCEVTCFYLLYTSSLSVILVYGGAERGALGVSANGWSPSCKG